MIAGLPSGLQYTGAARLLCLQCAVLIVIQRDSLRKACVAPIGGAGSETPMVWLSERSLELLRCHPRLSQHATQGPDSEFVVQRNDTAD